MKRITFIVVLLALAVFVTPLVMELRLMQKTRPAFEPPTSLAQQKSPWKPLVDFSRSTGSVWLEHANQDQNPRQRELAALKAQRRMLPTVGPGSHVPALQIDVDFPGEVSLSHKQIYDWGAFDALRLRVFAPAAAGPRVSATLALKHRVWGRFRTTPAQMLQPGEWNEIQWNIAHDSAEWVSEEHFRMWDGYVAQNVSELALRFFCDRPFSGYLYLEPLYGHQITTTPTLAILGPRVVSRPPPGGGAATDGGMSPDGGMSATTVLTGLPADAAPRVGRYDTFELAFNLSRQFKNPFDPEQISVDAEFVAPSGQKMLIPGFYYQKFIRRRRADRTEEVLPVGRGEWRVRFAPYEEGPYRYRLLARAADEATSTTPQNFVSVPSDNKGFIRWDKNDPSYLAWDNGEFHYPIGHTIRSPWDLRTAYDYEFSAPEGLGTYAYDDFLEAMEKCGENFGRVWMAAWWTALEWTPGYRSDYPGLGRYNQLNAWRMDYMMDAARDHGITIKICLQNHGQFSRRSYDHEWRENPYNIERGGILNNPSEYFHDPQARKLFKRRLRYLVARWSAHTNLQTWELWNEVDLVSNYNSEHIRNWHQEMARHLKQIDPFKHIVSTHYIRVERDPHVWVLPELEFTNNNSYTHEMVSYIINSWRNKVAYGKPAMINEYGVGNNSLELEYNMHAGIWTTYTTPFFQLGVFWWWHFLHEKDLYFHYRSVVDFHEGEDFRGQHLQHVVPRTDSAGKFMQAMGMQNRRRAYIWLYDRRIYVDRAVSSQHVPVLNGKVEIDQFEPGEYEYVFWDTWAGKPLKQGKVSHKSGPFVLETPPFSRDCALKVKRIETEIVSSGQ